VRPVTSYWTDPRTALDWARSDSQRDLLALPRTIAADIVAADDGDVLRIVDIGSGPGAFLSCFLDRLPDAHGLWCDISEAMESLARAELTRFGDRIDYRITDMTDLSSLPRNVDAIVTSRAAHHLDAAALNVFYGEAREHLAPGGWLVNLDHIGPDDAWDRRLRASRGRLIPRVSEQPAHHHNYPLTSMTDHTAALAAAGFSDVEIPWRAFVTCLFMARLDG
jgi:SAM-dependent methyltransferase